MAKLIKLDIFSGMPNPVFPIGDDLLSQVGDPGAASQDEPALLGYRGFRVIDTTSDLATPAATTEDQIGAFTQSALFSGNAQVERALLDAAHTAGAINDSLYSYAAGHIGSGGSALVSSTAPQGSDGSMPAGDTVSGDVTCPPCGGVDAPTYDPGFWNNDPNRQAQNNCYAYANNQATNTFAQPGRGTGRQYGSIDCDEVRTAAERDGLTTTGTYQASRAGWYVALVIWPGNDYHWYRQDDCGCWSHKPGSTKVRDVDNSGKRIADPSQCDRGPYSIFCTFMVTNGSVTIK